jgi:hypothetical protein
VIRKSKIVEETFHRRRGALKLRSLSAPKGIGQVTAASAIGAELALRYVSKGRRPVHLNRPVTRSLAAPSRRWAGQAPGKARTRVSLDERQRLGRQREYHAG